MTIKSRWLASLAVSCAVLCSPSTLYAHHETIHLTQEMIKSLESCEMNSRYTVKLNCQIYRQTTSYTCGPAAVMTLLNHYKLLSNSDMNRATELKIAAEMNAMAGDDGGTTVIQVANWLTRYGFQVDSGQKIETDMLIDNIQKNIPVLIAYNKHWLLASGFIKGKGSEEDQILFTDSAYNSTLLSRKQIDNMWLEASMPKSHCTENVGTYIIATPN